MKGYVYYSTQRPIGPGTCPSKGILKVCNYGHRSPIAYIGEASYIGEAWGAVVYDHELDFKEAAEYELKFGGETNI